MSHSMAQALLGWAAVSSAATGVYVAALSDIRSSAVGFWTAWGFLFGAIVLAIIAIKV